MKLEKNTKNRRILHSLVVHRRIDAPITRMHNSCITYMEFYEQNIGINRVLHFIQFIFVLMMDSTIYHWCFAFVSTRAYTICMNSTHCVSHFESVKLYCDFSIRVEYSLLVRLYCTCIYCLFVRLCICRYMHSDTRKSVPCLQNIRKSTNVKTPVSGRN